MLYIFHEFVINHCGLNFCLILYIFVSTFFIKINYFSEKYILKFWKGHRIKKGQKWNKNKKKMVKFRFFIIFYWVFGYFWTFAPSQKFSYIFFLKCPNFLMILIKIYENRKKTQLTMNFYILSITKQVSVKNMQKAIFGGILQTNKPLY